MQTVLHRIKKRQYNVIHPHAGPFNGVDDNPPTNPIDLLAWKHDLAYGEIGETVPWYKVNPAYYTWVQADVDFVNGLTEKINDPRTPEVERKAARFYRAVFISKKNALRKMGWYTDIWGNIQEIDTNGWDRGSGPMYIYDRWNNQYRVNFGPPPMGPGPQMSGYDSYDEDKDLLSNLNPNMSQTPQKRKMGQPMRTGSFKKYSYGPSANSFRKSISQYTPMYSGFYGRRGRGRSGRAKYRGGEWYRKSKRYKRRSWYY